GDADACIDPDDPCRALERMRGAHAGFQLIRLCGVALKRQLRFTADNRCSSSSNRRLRFFHCTTPRVNRALLFCAGADAESSSRTSMA
nr:hypothetical protein [Tanacetum cinerariifolium]